MDAPDLLYQMRRAEGAARILVESLEGAHHAADGELRHGLAWRLGDAQHLQRKVRNLSQHATLAARGAA